MQGVMFPVCELGPVNTMHGENLQLGFTKSGSDAYVKASRQAYNRCSLAFMFLFPYFFSNLLLFYVQPPMGNRFALSWLTSICIDK